MSDQTEPTKVASKFEELAEALEADIEDVTVTIEDGGFSSTVIDGADMADFLTEGEEEQTPTESEDTSEAGEPTIEDGEVACQCGAVFDSKNALYGHSSHCEEYQSEDTSEAGEDDIEDVEDTTEGGDDEVMSEAELRNHPEVKNSNIEDIRKYQKRNGICDAENCPYGANDDSDFCVSCASQQGSKSSSKSKSKTSKDSPKANRQMSDLSEAEKTMVAALIEDEGKSLEEAISMV